MFYYISCLKLTINRKYVEFGCHKCFENTYRVVFFIKMVRFYGTLLAAQEIHGLYLSTLSQNGTLQEAFMVQ